MYLWEARLAAIFRKLQLSNQHGITIAKKTVTLLYGMAVGRQCVFASRKCTDQHQQGGFRQVEIGDHRIHYLELVRRVNKYSAIPAKWF